MAVKKFVRVPGFHADSLPLASLEEIVNLMKDHQVEELKFSGNHQISIPENDQPTLDSIAEGLQKVAPQHGATAAKNVPGFTTIRTCPDTANCKHGIRDIGPLSELLNSIVLPGKLPAKVKVSIAGCKMCCTTPFVRDIGLIAQRKGWTLVFGGNSGGRPRIADVIGEGLTDGQSVDLILRCLIIYIKNAKPKMRTARFLEFYGPEKFVREVLDNPPE